MSDDDGEAPHPFDLAASIEGRLKALEIIVLLLMQDIAKDERRAFRLISGLRHVARELRAREEDEQIAYLVESRTDLLGRLVSKYKEDPFA